MQPRARMQVVMELLTRVRSESEKRSISESMRIPVDENRYKCLSDGEVAKYNIVELHSLLLLL